MSVSDITVQEPPMTEMTPAEAVFFAAVALPAADRAVYLARACAGNDDLPPG